MQAQRLVRVGRAGEHNRRHNSFLTFAGQLPPHLFAIGQAAYSALVNQRQNQAIVISGENNNLKLNLSAFQ